MGILSEVPSGRQDNAHSKDPFSYQPGEEPSTAAGGAGCPDRSLRALPRSTVMRLPWTADTLAHIRLTAQANQAMIETLQNLCHQVKGRHERALHGSLVRTDT